MKISKLTRISRCHTLDTPTEKYRFNSFFSCVTLCYIVTFCHILSPCDSHAQTSTLADPFEIDCLNFSKSSIDFPDEMSKIIIGELSHEIRRENDLHNVFLDSLMRTYHCAMYFASEIGQPYELIMTNDAKGDFCCPIQEPGTYYFVALGRKSYTQVFFFTDDKIKVHAKVPAKAPTGL